MKDRPLAHTKRGKLLAAAGGLAGGPLGIIVSPLVLILINATKKEGNRFLVWFLLGIPISAGLWFIQLLIISFGLSTDISESKSNGMKTWGEIAEAQQKMNNPDWCHEYWEGPFGDEYEILSCYQRIHSSQRHNEFRRIDCILNLDNPETHASTVSCEIAPNGYFTDDEVEQNKLRYGSKVSSSK